MASAQLATISEWVGTWLDRSATPPRRWSSLPGGHRRFAAGSHVALHQVLPELDIVDIDAALPARPERLANVA
ncbi:hypothetical protein EQG41_07735 [Billgrantia azerbaijanica]|nr:hypothetical protein EQG41_07735 [Halomonas azerbaijanica]